VVAGVVAAIAVLLMVLRGCAPSESAQKTEPKKIATRNSVSSDGKGAQENQQPSVSWSNSHANWEAVKNFQGEDAGPVERKAFEAARAGLAGAPADIPILILPLNDGFEVSTAVALRTGYSVTQRRNGVAYTVDASNSSATTGNEKIPDMPLTIDDMEGDRAVAFEKFGINYRITYSCDQPERRPECLSKEGAQDMAKSLVALRYHWR
jgi:hypothetical protein